MADSWVAAAVKIGAGSGPVTHRSHRLRVRRPVVVGARLPSFVASARVQLALAEGGALSTSLSKLCMLDIG